MGKVHASVPTITAGSVLWFAKTITRDKKRADRWCAMKETIESIPVERSAEQDAFANRKLIRPSLNRGDHNHNHNHNNHMNHSSAPMGERRPDRQDRGERNDRGDRNDRGMGGGRKGAPPDQTNAENFYYQKQMQSRTPMVVVLSDGEEIHGVIEWYDRSCIKLNRSGQPNLMIYKPSIKYMYKEGEARK
jgi:sRNA-binding regulator protein Hfq